MNRRGYRFFKLLYYTSYNGICNVNHVTLEYDRAVFLLKPWPKCGKYVSIVSTVLFFLLAHVPWVKLSIIKLIIEHLAWSLNRNRPREPLTYLISNWRHSGDVHGLSWAKRLYPLQGTGCLWTPPTGCAFWLRRPLLIRSTLFDLTCFVRLWARDSCNRSFRSTFFFNSALCLTSFAEFEMVLGTSLPCTLSGSSGVFTPPLVPWLICTLFTSSSRLLLNTTESTGSSFIWPLLVIRSTCRPWRWWVGNCLKSCERTTNSK